MRVTMDTIRKWCTERADSWSPVSLPLPPPAAHLLTLAGLADTVRLSRVLSIIHFRLYIRRGGGRGGAQSPKRQSNENYITAPRIRPLLTRMHMHTHS